MLGSCTGASCASLARTSLLCPQVASAQVTRTAQLILWHQYIVRTSLLYLAVRVAMQLTGCPGASRIISVAVLGSLLACCAAQEFPANELTGATEDPNRPAFAVRFPQLARALCKRTAGDVWEGVSNAMKVDNKLRSLPLDYSSVS